MTIYRALGEALRRVNDDVAKVRESSERWRRREQRDAARKDLADGGPQRRVMKPYLDRLLFQSNEGLKEEREAWRRRQARK